MVSACLQLRLELVLRGIKRSQEDKLRVRLQITIYNPSFTTVQNASQFSKKAYYESTMIWAAMTLTSWYSP